MSARHLLRLTDLDAGAFRRLLDLATEIKQHSSRYIRALYERTLLMIFEAPSLRTRLSFETAMTQLHGHAINYYTIHSPWGAGKESIEDVARTVSRYCDAVAARIFSHRELASLAAHARVPVINAMTNRGHPCQVLADFLTMREQLGRIEGIRIAYLGDGRNNVTYSLMEAAVLTGCELAIACPDDAAYRPEPGVLAELARCTGPGRYAVGSDPIAALAGAHVVYTDSWMSYRVAADQREQRLRDLAPYRLDRDLFDRARADARFMHCLPASREMEVAPEVIDGPRSIVFDQAENRLHMEKAILLDLLGGRMEFVP